MITIAIWCFALAVYLLFAGTISRNELITAAAVASFSAVWADLMRRNSRLRFKVSWDAVAPILRAVGHVFPATLYTAVKLLKVAAAGGSIGRSHDYRFRYGPTDAKPRGRRAIAVLGACLAPDSFVVNVDRDRQRVLMHHILRRDHPPDDRWLG